jgi:prolyl oligopeptidase
MFNPMTIHRLSRNLAFRSAARLVVALIAIAPCAAAQQARPDSAPDPYRWLEDVSGDRAMTWVKAENARTTAVLEKDPRYRAIYDEALRMAQAKDRIPYVSFHGGALYNFWQDSAHVRGLWRRTTLESYRSNAPVWTTVLDLDSLATAEKANWVWHGADCALPAERRCLLDLSDGGEDATTVREFDLASRTFVANGFSLSRGKQNVAWVGEDTVLVSREWNKGEVTASGYPYIVKRLARGQPLGDAVEIFRGDAKDVGVSPLTMVDGKGHRVAMIDRNVTFFESEHYLVRGTDVAKLNLPKKIGVIELFDGQVILRLAQDWTVGGTTLRAGSLATTSSRASIRT